MAKLSLVYFIERLKELASRLTFRYTPTFLYHYSELGANQVVNGFVFRVKTQGRMYALDSEFGQSTVLNGSRRTVIVFSERAVKKFVRHNILYIFGFKLFWGHYITPQTGDVEFTRVLHHKGDVVEVKDFEVISSTSLARNVLRRRVIGFRVLYASAALVGPCLALYMLCVIGSADLSEIYYGALSRLQFLPWTVFGIVFAFTSLSWLLEYSRVNEFEVALECARLRRNLPIAYRAFIVVWAWIATSLWVLCILSYTFIPWVWLMDLCFLGRWK